VSRWIPGSALAPFGQPAALFFHGVARKIIDGRIEINHHRLAAFRAIATQLKREFQVLPLDALNDAMRRPKWHKRTVFLMSDDGYANALDVAADVLAEMQLPWTLFVSTQHIETDELNPLILARLFLNYAPEGIYEVPHLDRPIVLNTAGNRARLSASVLQSLKHLPAARARESIAAMTAAFPHGRLRELRARFASEHYLTWSAVEALHRRGVEIGAHAHWHWPMHESESFNELRKQAELPRQIIMSRLGACRYFAYPFGNVGDVCGAAWQAVREAGYTHAFTTLSGTLRDGLNPWLLPRYALRAEEEHLPAVLPMLRIGNARVARL
jgi:peptidoglycan/xylan/chitin deacetylase (PgdA/CDA1 family)